MDSPEKRHVKNTGLQDKNLNRLEGNEDIGKTLRLEEFLNFRGMKTLENQQNWMSHVERMIDKCVFLNNEWTTDELVKYLSLIHI